MVIFFDNLESLQDRDTGELDNARIAAWIAAARSLGEQGLILLLTSRRLLPGWPDADHWSLEHANYGDFLRMGQEVLPPAFFRRRDRLRQVHQVLYGNGRGLTFFAAAIQGMNIEREERFLQQLAGRKAPRRKIWPWRRLSTN